MSEILNLHPSHDWTGVDKTCHKCHVLQGSSDGFQECVGWPTNNRKKIEQVKLEELEEENRNLRTLAYDLFESSGLDTSTTFEQLLVKYNITDLEEIV